MSRLDGRSLAVAAVKLARVLEVMLVSVAGQLLLACLKSYGMIQ